MGRPGRGTWGQTGEGLLVYEPPGRGTSSEAINSPGLPFWGRTESRRWPSSQLGADPVWPPVVAWAPPAVALISRSFRSEPWEESGLWLVFTCSRVCPISPPRPRGSALAAWPQLTGGPGVVHVFSSSCGHRSDSPPQPPQGS